MRVIRAWKAAGKLTLSYVPPKRDSYHILVRDGSYFVYFIDSQELCCEQSRARVYRFMAESVHDVCEMLLRFLTFRVHRCYLLGELECGSRACGDKFDGFLDFMRRDPLLALAGVPDCE